MSEFEFVEIMKTLYEFENTYTFGHLKRRFSYNTK